MAFIPRVGSLAVKAAAALFRTGPQRKWFSYGLYGATGVSLLIWMLLFADSYHGLGGSLDLFGDHSAWKEKAFVAVQLLTEVLVGASLFTRLERIMAQYAPDADVDNPRFGVLIERRNDLNAKLAEASAKLAELTGLLTLYDADMARQSQAARLLFRQSLARMNALSA